MSAEPTSLDETLVAQREQWQHGPPHELFRQLRAECPVHWSAGFPEYPEEPGYWSLTRADDIYEVSRDCQALIDARRENPTDDLTSVLVHAEVDGERLQVHEIVMGFFLLMAAGNDSTKATYCSAMRALMEHPGERRKLLDDPSLVPSAVE